MPFRVLFVSLPSGRNFLADPRNSIHHQKNPDMALFKQFLTILLPGCMFFSFITGCSKKGEGSGDDPPTIPAVTTDTVTAITRNTAASGGNVISEAGAAVTQRGICWSKIPDPQITDTHTTDGAGKGAFTSQMAGLSENTLYYVRAYATNSKGTAYGNTMTFTTLKITVDSVADIEGNIYHIVPIGSQSWLCENLKTTKYRNGDAIPNVTADVQWKSLSTGAYCMYDNLQANGTAYGNLYNWFALTDTRGLCPGGWHIPSDAEWATLGAYLGGMDVAGGLLKSTGTIEQSTGLWFAPNTGATNSSGFTGLPGGYRINYGTFYSLGNVGYFWSASDTAFANAWNYVLDANNGELQQNFNLKQNGFSVRCCRD